MSVRPDPDGFAMSAEARCVQLERRLARERKTRHETEAIAERGLREAFLGNQRFRLMCTIANAANDSVDPLETLRFALIEICAATGWVFGNALLRVGSEDDPRLEACGIWHALHPDEMYTFAEKSRQLVAWPCATAPGRLLIERHSVWTRDVHLVAGFGRSDEARRCHVRSSVSVPILQGHELVAAMEFFTPDRNQPEAELLETLDQIGTQIGRVFKRKSNERRLVDDALRDPLTGLPNRALFEAEMHAAFSRHTAAGRRRLSLIYIDLDGFKLVNDALGHTAGDALLVEMAERVRRVVESFATTPYPGQPDNALIARMGGDEFTILIDGEHHEEVACDVAAAIHECLRPSYRIDNSEVRCAASIGIAHDDGSYDGAGGLLRDADVAMYDAKARGPERTIVFDQAMRAQAVERLKIEAELRAALERGAFCLRYQPILDLQIGRVVGFEALLRWQRDGELVLPSEFLPIAVEMGLMNVLGTWVLREACRTAAEWRRELNLDWPFYISINVAPSQFLQPRFMPQIRDIIVSTNVDPRSLVIEVTESAAVIDPEQTRRVLDELRAMGVRVSLDDFGTGYSSFNHLQQFQFDTLKIDRSFVSDGEQTNTSHSIVDAMMQLARALDIDVVAEGIESQAQLDRLSDAGCGFGQGFLFNEATTAAHALALLRAPIPENMFPGT